MVWSPRRDGRHYLVLGLVCRTFKISGNFPRGRPKKTQNRLIRSDLKETKVSKNHSIKSAFFGVFLVRIFLWTEYGY